MFYCVLLWYWLRIMFCFKSSMFVLLSFNKRTMYVCKRCWERRISLFSARSRKLIYCRSGKARVVNFWAFVGSRWATADTNLGSSAASTAPSSSTTTPDLRPPTATFYVANTSRPAGRLIDCQPFSVNFSPTEQASLPCTKRGGGGGDSGEGRVEWRGERAATAAAAAAAEMQ